MANCTKIFTNDEADIDEEVIITKNIFTSTPVGEPRKRKRTPTKSSPRRTRLRSRTMTKSNSSVASEDASDASDVSKIAAELAKINANMTKMENTIKSTVAEAVAPLSIKLDCTTKRIDEMESRHASEMEKASAKISEQIQRAIEAKISQLSSAANGREKTGNISYANAAATAPTPGPGSQACGQSTSASQDWFWNARRCLRFFPIIGKTENQMRTSLDKFFSEKLKIPTGDLSNDDINFIRRTRATKRSKIQDEVLVSFTSTAARDLVQSHAKNISSWIGEDGKPLAGVRMEVPERLMSDFKSLEQYGHAMREKYGREFKRHTKMDDAGLCVYLDVYLPGPKVWMRVDVDLARKDNQQRLAKKSNTSNSHLLSTASGDEMA